MIIPNFRCRQDGQFVYVEIKATNCRLERTEFDLNENVVIFTSPPYHLRLNLPGNVTSTEDDESCKWNSDTNEFVLKLKKTTENEHFEGLDLISRLLTAPTEAELKSRNLIEVVGQSDQSEDQSDQDDQDDIFDQDFQLNEYEQSTKSVLDSKHKYGFLNRHSGLLEKYQDDLWQLADIQNPGELNCDERRRKRLQKENEDFNEEHYLFDQYENNRFIDDLRLKKSEWLDGLVGESTSGVGELVSEAGESTGNASESTGNASESTGDVSKSASRTAPSLTDDEIFRLKNLPRKEFKLTKDEKVVVLYGLVDILFAYCYDKRINEGEESRESAWTISKLSSMFSCFDAFWTADDLVDACMRRSLCYPLYRNYELSKAVFGDVIRVLRGGRMAVIKCLLEIQRLFNEYGDFKYLLNELFVNDYLLAIQYLDEKYFDRLIELVESRLPSICKDRLDLDLVLLDKAAESTILEHFEELKC